MLWTPSSVVPALWTLSSVAQCLCCGLCLVPCLCCGLCPVCWIHPGPAALGQEGCCCAHTGRAWSAQDCSAELPCGVQYCDLGLDKQIRCPPMPRRSHHPNIALVGHCMVHTSYVLSPGECSWVERFLSPSVLCHCSVRNAGLCIHLQVLARVTSAR